jgi:hypothetical protein
LFQKDVRTINEHIGHIFEEGELAEDSVIRRFRITAADGKTYETQHYNLEMIISVGYRVRSQRGTQFRRWATERLREYLVKGFTMDDERLKNPSGKGHTDYFDELLERIQDIRASERRMYLRVRDILALAADYSSGLRTVRRTTPRSDRKRPRGGYAERARGDRRKASAERERSRHEVVVSWSSGKKPCRLSSTTTRVHAWTSPESLRTRRSWAGGHASVGCA